MTDTTIYITGSSIEIDSPRPVKLVLDGFIPKKIKQLGGGCVEISSMDDVEMTLVEDDMEWIVY